MNRINRSQDFPPESGKKLKDEMEKKKLEREKKASEQKALRELRQDLRKLRQEVNTKSVNEDLAKRIRLALEDPENPIFRQLPAERQVALREGLTRILENPGVIPENISQTLSGAIPSEKELQSILRSFNVDGFERSVRNGISGALTRDMVRSAAEGLRKFGIDIDEETATDFLQNGTFDFVRWMLGNFFSTLPVAGLRDYGRTLHERVAIDAYLAQAGDDEDERRTLRANITDTVLRAWRIKYEREAADARAQRRQQVRYPPIEDAMDADFQKEQFEWEQKQKKTKLEGQTKQGDQKVEAQPVILGGLTIPPGGLTLTPTQAITLPQYGSPQRVVALDRSGSSHRIQVGTGDQRITIKMGSGAGEDPEYIRIKRPEPASTQEVDIRVEVQRGATTYIVKFGPLVTAIDGDRSSATRKLHAVIRASDVVELQ